MDSATFISPPPDGINKNKPQLKLPGHNQNVPIVVSIYQLYGSFHEMLSIFPKTERYSLGASCQTEILLILRLCLKSASTSDISKKAELLHETSASLDTLRLLLCLCKDCRCISNQPYQQLDSKLSEIGRMLGGWLKSTSSP